MNIARARALPYRLPLPAPIRTAQGRFTAREGWWIRLEDDAGRVGWGEVATWPGFGAGRVAAQAEVARAVPACAGRPVAQDPIAATPEVQHGLTLALADLRAQAAGLSLAEWLAPGAPTAAASHVLVADAAAAEATSAAALKIKVGAGPLAEDVQRVQAIRAARPDAALRVDANGAWDRPTAAAALSALAPLQPAWVEQPLAPSEPPEALAALRGPCPIAADEAVTGPAALRALLAADAVDVVVLKPMFVGGPAATLALGRAARAAGLQICITHALGSAVERWAAVHVACALAADGPVAGGLLGGPATPGWDGPADADGQVQRPTGPGLGGAPAC